MAALSAKEKGRVFRDSVCGCAFLSFSAEVIQPRVGSVWRHANLADGLHWSPDIAYQGGGYPFLAQISGKHPLNFN